MPKKSTKSLSKRKTLRKKHKIMKKVKAHNRKERKKHRKLALENKAKGIKPFRSDPGVPSKWPFKEQFLKEMVFEKERILAQKKSKTPNKDVVMATNALEDMALEANQRGENFESDLQTSRDETDPNIGGREHVKDFRKLVSLSDVVVQVLDARDPLGCRSEEVESLVKGSSPQKRLVFLMNKIGRLSLLGKLESCLGLDLVPRENVEAWLAYLRQFAPTIAFKSSTQRQSSNLGQSKNRTMESKSSVCLGADNLIQLLKNYSRSAEIKTAITVGLVGVPNVGKSSIINSLKRSRAAKVGNQPGVTKNLQEVHLDSQIRLLDSPGVIYETRQGILQGVVRTEKLDDPIGVAQRIVEKTNQTDLTTLYKTERGHESAIEFLQLLAKKTGKLKKGGTSDTEAASKIIIQDWNNGKIPYWTNPPPMQRATDVQIVEEWAKGFDFGQSDEILDECKKEAEATVPVSLLTDKPIEEKSEALKAFSRMGEIQNRRAEIKNASEALTGMTLTNSASDSKTTSATPDKPNPVVQVIHRSSGSTKRSKKKGRPNESFINLTKPNSQSRTIHKKKKRAQLKKLSASTKIDEIAEGLSNSLNL